MRSDDTPPSPERRPRRRPALALAGLLLACAARQEEGVEPSPPLDANHAEMSLIDTLSRGADARPDDASLRYVLALLEERRGEPANALARLRELLPLGWDYGLDDHDFPLTRTLPGYAEVARELAARQPQVHRGEVVRELAPGGLFSEGIAWDPGARVLFFGDAPTRRIVQVPLDGAPRPFGEPAPGDMLAPLGMHVDPATQTLWVASVAFEVMEGFTEADAGRSRLVALDLASGRARASFAIGDPAKPSLLNDVAPLPGGRAAVTDSRRGALYLGELAGRELRLLTPERTFTSPNGVVADDAGATLYVADLHGLSAVDPTTGETRRLAAPPGTYLGGVDGLSFHSGRLFAVQNLFGGARIWTVALTEEGLGAPTILSSGDPRVDGPTTAAIAEGGLWLLANPQIRGSATDPRAPLRLLKIPLDAP